MKFSIWFYACKFGIVIFPVAGLGLFVGEDHRILSLISSISLLVIIGLGSVGAFLGILLAFGKLKMKCPFCSSYGSVGGDHEDGLWMDCPDCGFIHSTGPFGLKLMREKQKPNQRANPTASGS